ncbi:hypothetical protein ACH5RR_040987 [Cinchona calisaya]|uniref:FAS1 domain-containing protein n=1 Tax=Cinchona calisaya TaxID=153742 RepID=A0ABD2XW98_9GENT
MGASKNSTSPIFLFFLLLVSSAATSAFNVTNVLEKDSRFSTFNDLLLKANLVGDINREGVVTVLAIPNDNIGDLAGKPTDVIKTILKTHVVLDYYDILKLRTLNKPTIMTNLFQKSGVATYGQGFLNVTKNGTVDQTIFASSVKGAPHDVHLLGTVAAIPPKLSVLSVSHNIMTPGIEAITFAPPPPAKAPAPAHKAAAPSPDNREPDAPSPSDDAPSPSDDATPPSEAPTADAPKPESPVADAADADAPKGASFKHLASSSLGLVLVLASFLAAY